MFCFHGFHAFGLCTACFYVFLEHLTLVSIVQSCTVCKDITYESKSPIGYVQMSILGTIDAQISLGMSRQSRYLEPRYTWIAHTTLYNLWLP